MLVPLVSRSQLPYLCQHFFSQNNTKFVNFKNEACVQQVHMINALVLVLLFTLIAVGTAMDPNLLNNLRSEVHRIATDVPWNAPLFVIGMITSGRRGDAVTDMGGVEHTARNWGLPEHAVQRFKSAMFAANMAFQTFQVTIPARVADATSIATMDEIVGVARNNGGQIQMAYAWATCHGRLIGQFDTIEFRKCKKVLFVKKCKNGHANVPRGFTVSFSDSEVAYLTIFRPMKLTSSLVPFVELLITSSFANLLLLFLRAMLSPTPPFRPSEKELYHSLTGAHPPTTPTQNSQNSLTTKCPIPFLILPMVPKKLKSPST